MNKNFLKWLAVPAMLALLGQGCARSTPPATTGTAPGSGSPTAGTTSGSGRCVNAYYPLEAGSSIEYKMVSGGQTLPFTIAVLEHDNEGIVLEYTFIVEGRTSKIKHEMVCDGGTIRGKGHFDFAAAFLPFEVRYDVLSMDGEIMPADIRVGSEWDMNSQVKLVTTDTGPVGRVMNGTISTTRLHNKVVAEENVTVPAGTYRALKIEQTVRSSTSVMGRAMDTTVTNVAWYARDVGLLKSQNTAAGSDFVMEAQVVNR
jgi:hypothetical protein